VKFPIKKDENYEGSEKIMPRGDRTGPYGAGPRTGRGLGYCAGYDTPGFTKGRGLGLGRGFGLGMGRGLGLRWGHRGGPGGFRTWAFAGGVPPAYMPPAPPQITKEQQKEFVEQEIDFLSKQVEALKKQLEDLEKTD